MDLAAGQTGASEVSIHPSQRGQCVREFPSVTFTSVHQLGQPVRRHALGSYLSGAWHVEWQLGSQRFSAVRG